MHFIFFILCFFISFLYSSPTIQELSTEEKIGQLFVICFDGQSMNEEVIDLLQTIQPGGIIYYNYLNGLSSPEQVNRLSRQLNDYALSHSPFLPFFLCVDQEGGQVTRLKEGFSDLPSAQKIGSLNKRSMIENYARTTAKELLDVGINVNLAPVLDLQAKQKNTRSYSADPLRVAEIAEIILASFNKEGLLGCLKHFPGHGSVETDSHEALPVLRKSLTQLEREDMLPFLKVLNKASFIMPAHILCQAIDPDNCVTLSKIFLTDLLRKKLSFQGVIISDSLTMQGVLTQTKSLESAALRAFQAGCDILLLGGKKLNEEGKKDYLSKEEIKAVKERLLQAVIKKEITQERLDESVERIIHLKKMLKR
ncbi:MAG: beta-N-acetylhexosaminidase [Rhabdochlamydiaceae bacterium]